MMHLIIILRFLRDRAGPHQDLFERAPALIRNPYPTTILLFLDIDPTEAPSVRKMTLVPILLPLHRSLFQHCPPSVCSNMPWPMW